MKEKMQSVLGVFGSVLWYAISILISFAPLITLGFNFWVDALLIFVVTTIPYIGMVVSLILWVWSLVLMVQRPFGVWSVVYFVALIINVVIYVVPFIQSLFESRITERR
jgi:hypothetical protein